ncbi:FAR1 DNA binding domain, zinc finger, SWIM-type, MULE transposase domain containing protein [Tanacetum coccineum]
MDDEPMWAADRVVAPTPGSAITIPETTNEFAIKGTSNSDTDKIMARMDAMTLKMDAQYKEFQSRSKQPNPDYIDDGTSMSRVEEAKFMQTFCRTRFYNDYRDRDSNPDNWRSSGINDYNRDNYQSNSDDKPNLQKQLSNFIKVLSLRLTGSPNSVNIPNSSPKYPVDSSVCNIDKGKGIAVASSVCSAANGKGKGKVTVDLFSGKGKTIDFSDVSNPDDVFSGKGVTDLFIGDRDAQMVVEKLENLEKRCDSFFMDYCQGEGDSLCGLFWADKVARLNYQRFGDTISFDATFRSNKYRMVFVPFTGIDNHNRSNIDYGALFFNSDAKLWFVGCSSVCNKSNFKERFCIVWNERISIDMFEQEWASIMDEFDLGSHKWLCDLYGMRHRWIPAFLRNEDMSGLINNIEKKNDHESRYNRPEFRTDWPLEKDAAELFTLNIFYEIQDEIVASIAKCLSVNVEQMGGSEKYFIRDTDVKKWKDSTQFEVYEVFYCSSDTILTCSCRQYVLDRWSKSDENVWVDTSAVACETSSDAAIRAIQRIFEDTVDRLVPFKESWILYGLDIEPETVVIKVPRHSANKGTGSHKRWKNMDELIQNAAESSKKRRTCFVCGKAEGHNCRTCPHKDEINAANKRTKRVTRSSAVNYEE